MSRTDASVLSLCDLTNPDTQQGIDFTSLTFSRDDRLFASRQGSLYEISLPDCEVSHVGDYGAGITSVNGITPDEAYELFAVDSTTSSVYRVDPDTAVATLIGPAGINLGSSGATWHEESQRLLAISSNTDKMYEVNTLTGEYVELADLEIPIISVGFEYHPQGDQMYVCTSTPGPLYEVDESGQMDFLGDTGLHCDDLAAPWDDVVLPQ